MIDSVKRSIENRNFGEAINMLLETCQKNNLRYHNELILHKAKLNQTLEDERKELLTTEEIRREKAKIANALLDLTDIISEEINESNEKPVTQSNYDACISYSWTDEDIVNEIDNAFQKEGIILIRDKRDAQYKADLKTFMKRIGTGNFVIIVISDKYLKSRNCMYEVLELLKNNDFKNRIFPIVLADAHKIYNALNSLEYISFWDNQISQLNESIKNITNLANTSRAFEEINHCQRIRNSIDGFINAIQNMNTLTIDIHKNENFSSIINWIKRKKNEPPPKRP